MPTPVEELRSLCPPLLHPDTAGGRVGRRSRERVRGDDESTTRRADTWPLDATCMHYCARSTYASFQLPPAASNPATSAATSHTHTYGRTLRTARAHVCQIDWLGRVRRNPRRKEPPNAALPRPCRPPGRVTPP